MTDPATPIKPQPESHRPARRSKAEVGRAGEEAAAQHFMQLGYRLIERNWRCRAGEIDLIVQGDATLVFVEVRSRSNPTTFGTAIEAVTPRKCRQVREVASVYLKKRNIDAQLSIRFDVAAVTFDKRDEIIELKHIQAAF